MRTTMLTACLFFLPMFAGCTLSDAFFMVLGDRYTGGGYTREEKEHHYDQQVEAFENDSRRNP